MKQSFRGMWGPVILLGIATGIGLLAALLGDGAWDWLSAGGLGAPVAAALWYGVIRQ